MPSVHSEFDNSWIHSHGDALIPTDFMSRVKAAKCIIEVVETLDD